MRLTRTHLVLLALAAVVSGCTHTLHATVAGAGEAPRGISVSGEGEAKAAPDIARVSLGVESRMPRVEEATSDANTRMNAVLAALKQAGVAAKDLRTHGFSVGFEPEYEPPMPPRAEGEGAPKSQPRGHYRVSNMVEVTVRDVAKAGELISLATSAGANNVWGVSFDLDQPDALRRAAREQAFARAQKNAEELARLGGVKLGKLLAISESESGGGYPMPMMKAMREDAAQSTPIEQGEIAVRHHVQLVYEVAH